MLEPGVAPLPAGVALPENLTWTVQVSGRTGNPAALGPVHSAGASVGDALGGVWEHAGAGWTHVAPAEPVLGFRIEAVACAADFNGGGVALGDIFDYINGWFAGDARADFDGVGGLTVADVLGFVGAWFAPC